LSLKDNNPWKIQELCDSKEKVLPDDKRKIDKNETGRCQTAHTRRSKKLRLELCPMPFVGDIEEANVYLLQANPGVGLAPLSEKNVSAKSEIKDEYREKICNCLKQEFDGYDYPFYLTRSVARMVMYFREVMGRHSFPR
jgi:hypothetical protein